jgi:hypothetical protein
MAGAQAARGRLGGRLFVFAYLCICVFVHLYVCICVFVFVPPLQSSGPHLPYWTPSSSTSASDRPTWNVECDTTIVKVETNCALHYYIVRSAVAVQIMDNSKDMLYNLILAPPTR